MKDWKNYDIEKKKKGMLLLRIEELEKRIDYLERDREFIAKVMKYLEVILVGIENDMGELLRRFDEMQ